MGSKAGYVDIYPMIWNEYKKNGYVTGFLEDVPSLGDNFQDKFIYSF